MLSDPHATHRQATEEARREQQQQKPAPTPKPGPTPYSALFEVDRIIATDAIRPTLQLKARSSRRFANDRRILAQEAPDAVIRMQVTNPDIVRKIRVGDRFKVDFTPIGRALGDS